MKTILVDAWNTFVLKEGINEDMKIMLDAFPNPKIIVTNANADQMVELGIVDMPYEVYTLAHNPDKTDPGYFVKMFAEKGLAIADVVYFEHNPAAVEAAKSLGITAFWYDKDAKDIEVVRQFLEEHLS